MEVCACPARPRPPPPCPTLGVRPCSACGRVGAPRDAVVRATPLCAPCASILAHEAQRSAGRRKAGAGRRRRWRVPWCRALRSMRRGRTPEHGVRLVQVRGANGNAMAEHHVVDEKPDLHGPVKVARGQGFIRAPPQEVLNMLIAVERRPDWDDLCDYASRVRFPSRPLLPPPFPLIRSAPTRPFSRASASSLGGSRNDKH